MLDDESLARAMKAADRARTPADAPMSLRAEADLQRILDSEPEMSRTREHRPRRRWIGVSVLAALAVLILAIAQSTIPHLPGEQSAAAVTPPLLHGDGMPIGLEAVVKQAKAVLAGDAESHRSAAYSAWFLQTDVAADPTATVSYVSPQDITTTWNPDLSGRMLTVAGNPIATGDTSAGLPQDLPTPGTVIQDDSFAQGEMGILYTRTPPTNADAMRAYLAEGAGITDETDPVQMVDAAQLLLAEWTLGRAAQRALLDVLSTLTAQPMGAVTDRLGRGGVGFVMASSTDKRYEDILILAPQTGAVLGIEKVYLGGVPDYAALTTPAVISYLAWK